MTDSYPGHAIEGPATYRAFMDPAATGGQGEPYQIGSWTNGASKN